MGYHYRSWRHQKDDKGVLHSTLYTKIQHLDEVDQFLEKYKLTKLTKYEIDHLNCPVTI